jgi:hypothetical protein
MAIESRFQSLPSSRSDAVRRDRLAFPFPTTTAFRPIDRSSSQSCINKHS